MFEDQFLAIPMTAFNADSDKHPAWMEKDYDKVEEIAKAYCEKYGKPYAICAVVAYVQATPKVTRNALYKAAVL